MYISVERRKIRQKCPTLEGRSDVLRRIDAGRVTSGIAAGWLFGAGGSVGGRRTRSLGCVEHDARSAEVGQSAQMDTVVLRNERSCRKRRVPVRRHGAPASLLWPSALLPFGGSSPSATQVATDTRRRLD